ncbi:rCG26879 [Rattus norvegicus]|uniref:RCG26879 n=1 Tax=Rattus norvegicus TaxID=10116 RepID=A6HN67_RAT|nr:rCG26879 [Rattus norvegicus]
MHPRRLWLVLSLAKTTTR